MNNTDKIRALQALDEKQLRQNVLIPLLGFMQYKAASEYHGSRELGKDIICFWDDKLGKRRYLALVAKITDFTGSVSSTDGLMEVKRQIEQCFDTEYHDLFGMRSITMDEVWAVTTGKVVSGAAESIIGSLKKTNLAKLTSIISGEELVQLIDKYYALYWDKDAESPAYVKGQRDRFLAFSKQLLKKLGATDDAIKELTGQLLYSSTWIPNVELFSPDLWRIRHASSYALVLEKSKSRYAKGMVSDACGYIEDGLEEARESTKAELYEVEDMLEKAYKALSLTDPWEFVSAFESDLEDEYPFHRSYGRHEALQKIGYLIDGLEDLDRFLKRLSDSGKKDFFVSLVQSLEKIEEEVGQYITKIESPKFALTWQVVDRNGSPAVLLLYDQDPQEGADTFTTTHEKEVNVYSRWGSKRRSVSARDVLLRAQLALREHIANQLPACDE